MLETRAGKPGLCPPLCSFADSLVLFPLLLSVYCLFGADVIRTVCGCVLFCVNWINYTFSHSEFECFQPGISWGWWARQAWVILYVQPRQKKWKWLRHCWALRDLTECNLRTNHISRFYGLKPVPEAGKITQWLRMLAALAEDRLELVPRIHVCIATAYYISMPSISDTIF